MAAPRTGRLFFRSHGDCFIHATASFVKYWNSSLALVSCLTQHTLILLPGLCITVLQEGLTIVKVTLASPQERVFLSCMSPRPIPYKHVPKGMSHRTYMEIDPKFAAELGISNDTEVSYFWCSGIVCLDFKISIFTFFQVVLESISSIEKCLKLKIAPKNPTDMDILVCNEPLMTCILTVAVIKPLSLT